jgi:hypothetical protein
VEADPLLRRIGRTAMVVCAGMATLALIFSPSHLMSAAAVIGGGLIAGASYWSIQSGVTALVDRMVTGASSPPRPQTVRATALKLTGRYALLGFAAYVMIARLRLPPLGLLAGASSIVAAVAVEAVRLLILKDPSPRT